jgi:chaperone modulatory protein CbpM
MNPEHGEGVWLEGHELVSIAELVAHCGLSEGEVRELVDYGALEPVDAVQWTFKAECMVVLRRASRLKGDLELDTPALALTLSLLEQISALEGQLAKIRARLPHRAPG